MNRKTIFYGFWISVIVAGRVEINVPSFKNYSRYYESFSLYWRLKNDVDKICIVYVEYMRIEFSPIIKNEIIETINWACVFLF